MSESSSAIKRYGNRYSDKLYPNICCLFLDAYCVGKHQILRKSSNFHKIPLVNHWIFRKYRICSRIEVFCILQNTETSRSPLVSIFCNMQRTPQFEGNDNASYNCNIISHNAKLIHREDGNYFMATATVSTQGQNTPI